MNILFNVAKRLFYRYRIHALEAEQRAIDRMLREADADLLGLRMHRSELVLELSQIKAQYRALAKPFETIPHAQKQKA